MHESTIGRMRIFPSNLCQMYNFFHPHLYFLIYEFCFKILRSNIGAKVFFTIRSKVYSGIFEYVPGFFYQIRFSN